MTHKILKSARRQQKDLQDELFEVEDFDESEGQKEKPTLKLGSNDAESGDESDLDEFVITPKNKDHEVEVNSAYCIE